MPPREIVVADDGSDVVTLAVVKKLTTQMPAPLRHFWHKDSGFRKTKILNQAISEARGNYIVLLDGDCVPHRRFIADHSKLAEQGWWVQGRRSFIREHFSPSFQTGPDRIFQLVVARTDKRLVQGRALAHALHAV